MLLNNGFSFAEHAVWDFADHVVPYRILLIMLYEKCFAAIKVLLICPVCENRNVQCLTCCCVSLLFVLSVLFILFVLFSLLFSLFVLLIPFVLFILSVLLIMFVLFILSNLFSCLFMLPNLSVHD